MLEIIAIILLARHLGSTAKRKGYSNLWGALGPAMWLGFEFFGAFFAACAGADGLVLYAVALVAALAGGGLSHLVVTALPDRLADAAGAAAVGRDPDEVRDNPFA